MTIRLDSGTARYELDLCQTHLGELTGAGKRLCPASPKRRSRLSYEGRQQDGRGEDPSVHGRLVTARSRQVLGSGLS